MAMLVTLLIYWVELQATIFNTMAQVLHTLE